MSYSNVTELFKFWSAFNVVILGFMYVILLFADKVAYNVWCMLRRRR